MKVLISLLILLSTNVFAASGSGNISNIVTFGGAGTTISDNLNIPESNSQGYVSLYVGGSQTSPNYYPLYKNGVAYQVTAGKTFNVVKICGLSASTTSAYQIVTATASFASNAASLTGGVYMNGAALGGNAGPLYTHSVANTWLCFSQTYVAAASTYMGIQSGASATNAFIVLGRELP